MDTRVLVKVLTMVTVALVSVGPRRLVEYSAPQPLLAGSQAPIPPEPTSLKHAARISVPAASLHVELFYRPIGAGIRAIAKANGQCRHRTRASGRDRPPMRRPE